MDSTWKAIPSVPGFEASDRGEIRSWIVRYSKRRAIADQPRIVPIARGRYCSFGLPGGKPMLVHRAVLEAFVGPQPEGMEACHCNGDRHDNRPENLRWDTRKNNHADKRKHGTRQCGARSGMAKLSDDKVAMIRGMKSLPVVVAQRLAKEWGVYWTHLYNVKSGMYWISDSEA